MPAIPTHDTQVIDEPWDASAEVAKLNSPITKSIGTGEFAWYDPNGNDGDGDGYPDAKDDWSFPHHKVNGDGRPGAANVRALRNGLARVGNSSIPEADKDGVRKHLQHHLDAFNANKSEQPAASARAGSVLWAAGLVGKTLALRGEIVELFQVALAAGEQPPIYRADDTSGDEPTPGIIPLYGLITPHGSLLSMLFGLGGSGLDVFRAQLDAAVSDPSVSHIVLDVDSPGGLVDMVPETAAEIRQARDVKPITAVANTDAASAAYWLASQANELVITPSGQVGSIGVYQMHRDVSAAQEQLGIKMTLISAGKYKVEGNMYQPLSADARKAKQDVVDEIYGWFVSDVAAGRGTTESAVRNGFGEGRTLLATKALQEGVVDRVATLEQVITAIMPGATAPEEPPSPDSEAKALDPEVAQLLSRSAA